MIARCGAELSVGAVSSFVPAAAGFLPCGKFETAGARGDMVARCSVASDVHLYRPGRTRVPRPRYTRRACACGVVKSGGGLTKRTFASLDFVCQEGSMMPLRRSGKIAEPAPDVTVATY